MTRSGYGEPVSIFHCQHLIRLMIGDMSPKSAEHQSVESNVEKIPTTITNSQAIQILLSENDGKRTRDLCTFTNMGDKHSLLWALGGFCEWSAFLKRTRQIGVPAILHPLLRVICQAGNPPCLCSFLPCASAAQRRLNLTNMAPSVVGIKVIIAGSCARSSARRTHHHRVSTFKYPNTKYRTTDFTWRSHEQQSINIRMLSHHRLTHGQ